MSKKKQDIYKARLRALQKLGFFPNYKAGAALTETQKRHIRDKFRQFGEIATASKGEFKAQDISKLPRERKQALKESGYAVHGNKVYIPQQGGYSQKLVTSKKVGGKTVDAFYMENVFRDKTGKVVKEFQAPIIRNRDFPDWQKRLFAEYEKAGFDKSKLGRSEFVGVRMWNHGVFKSQFFPSYESALHFISQYDGTAKIGAGYHDNIHLVRMTTDDFRKLADLERSIKKRTKTSKQTRQETGFRGRVKRRKVNKTGRNV